MERPGVGESTIKQVFEDAVKLMNHYLKEKGPGAFVSSHEILGVVTEEYEEMKDAVHENREGRLEAELFDITIACLFAAASIRSNALDR